MDILKCLPEEKWPLLLDSSKRNWPIYSPCYNWVKNTIKWRRENSDLPHTIFCPDGKPDSGIFVGIMASSLYMIVVFAFEENKEELRKVLLETTVIDWDRKEIFFSDVHQHVSDIVSDVIREKMKIKNLKIDCICPSNSYFKSKEECVMFVPQISPECELKSLNLTHVPLIHSLWSYRDMVSLDLTFKLIETYVKFNRSLGLFLKKDNSLISWILVNEWGTLGLLQTTQDHQGRGYAKLLIQTMAKELAEKENLDSVLFITKDNAISENLFQSLGYKRVAAATAYSVVNLNV